VKPRRADLVAHARRSIMRGSRSFGAASRLFDRPTRERAWLLYAWCRRCDDLADGQDHGHGARAVADPAARLAEITARTETALAGGTVGDPAFDALGQVALETRLPHAFARDLIAGFALDAGDWRPRSEHDLLTYCYHVAGTVGCMMAVVMGVDPADAATLDRACDLGIAFQLANIMRDVEEDDRAGRCYLPVEWLAEMDIPPGQHMKPWHRPQLVALVERLGRLAAAHEASARHGTPALPFRAAWAVLAAADIYGGIARAVLRRGGHAWDHRTTISAGAKLVAVGRAWRLARRRDRLYPLAERADSLWRRPGR
jgi:phytoene synthase